MRSALYLTFFALAACMPEGESAKEEKRAPSLPYGFELAAAQGGPDGEDAMLVELSAAELAARLPTGTIRLIDVRTDEEVAEGMLPGAEHIALDRFDPSALALSGDDVVVLYCRSGRRSGIAAERLAVHTGEPAAHLAGGILAWREAGGEVVRPE